MLTDKFNMGKGKSVSFTALGKSITHLTVNPPFLITAVKHMRQKELRIGNY